MSEAKKYKHYDSKVIEFLLEDELLRRQAREIKEIYQQKNVPPFEVAFRLLDGYNAWKKERPGCSFRYYVHLLAKAEQLKNKESTLKLSLKVARCFPDLSEPKNRKATFDCYREIVNVRDLDQTDMNELRQEAEENNYSGRKVRQIIKNRFGKNEEEEPKKTFFQKSIIYKDDERFIKEIKEFLEGPNRPKEGTKFLFKQVRR